jgi:hypothetical protein
MGKFFARSPVRPGRTAKAERFISAIIEMPLDRAGAEAPDLQPEDIRACIAYASRYLDHAVLVHA